MFTQISPNETAAICRDFKETTMFGLCPRHRFLLLWRIFRASPIEECAKFILFPSAARAARWEKAKSVIFAFSGIRIKGTLRSRKSRRTRRLRFVVSFSSRNFFRADERNFRDLRTTPRIRHKAFDGVLFQEKNKTTCGKRARKKKYAHSRKCYFSILTIFCQPFEQGFCLIY